MQSEHELTEQIAALTDALLEQRLDAEGARRLEELVSGDQAARRIYLRYMHLTCSIPPHVGAPAEPLLADDAANHDAMAPDVMSETIMMPALRPDMRSDEPAPLAAPVMIQPPRNRLADVLAAGRYRAAAAVFIVVSVGILIYWANSPHATTTTLISKQRVPTTSATLAIEPDPAPAPQSVARLTALAAPALDDPGFTPPGTLLFPGRVLRIRSGAAEVTFNSGVVVVVEGPASFTIVDGSRALLQRGKICAHVPHPAGAFSVTSSKLTVTDLGTEFAMSVDPAGTAVTHVFEGRVSVALPSQSPAATAPAGTRVLTVNQTVRCPVAGGKVESLPAFTDTFTRDISRYIRPLPLHNTGAGIDEGQPDSNWEFVADSNDASLKPRPANVVAAFRSYVPNADESRWISVMSHLAPAPSGIYTFRTHVDLGGLNPATATILARVAADDEIREIRINGHAMQLPPLGDDGRQYGRLHDLPITGGFVEGVNTIEIDVFNLKEEMALRVEWQGTAGARVLR